VFRIIEFQDKILWNSIVKSFQHYEVYYLHGYVSAFRVHGDGEPLLIYYNNNGCRAINVVMVRDLGDIPHLNLPKGELFDLVTPYGYGGFLVEGELPDSFVGEYQTFCLDNKYLTEFTRMAPFAPVVHPYGEVLHVGTTVSMDTTSKEIIQRNLSSKNRNMIRKAMKNGITIHHGLNEELMSAFIPLYNATMEQNAAKQYYFFAKPFYENILQNLKDNALLFYARKEDTIIAMAIILFDNGHAHYHLSCTDYQYRSLAPMNLLLYKVALWCLDNNITLLHLGGGVGGSKTDSLFEFKKSFNRYDENKYCVGKYIVDKERYELNTKDYPDTDFFPNYRGL
jgi:hypothetical protein